MCRGQGWISEGTHAAEGLYLVTQSSDRLKYHDEVFVTNSLCPGNLSLRYNLTSFICCYDHVKPDQPDPKGL